MSDEQEQYRHAQQLISEFGEYHGEIDLVRNLVRQRRYPYEELKGKRIITVRQARAFALVYQLRSFLSRATTRIEVKPESNTDRAWEKSTRQEKYLAGVEHAVNSKQGFVYSDAMWHGMEAGSMILGLSFNVGRARQGLYPFVPKAIDPRCAAYQRSDTGLTCFVTDETVEAARFYADLSGAYARGKNGKRGDAGSVRVRGQSLEVLARERPTEPLRVVRKYDDEQEYLWVDGTIVWIRPHYIPTGVPFTVGYFYDMPSDRPSEWGKGAISPIRELLEEEETLWDIYATDAELGSRPLVLYFDQPRNQWVIGRMMPGAKYDAPQTVKPENIVANPNYQLLGQLASMLNEQIELNTLPKSNLLSGSPTPASGFSISLQNEPIKARLESLRPGAEVCLATHYEMLLGAYKYFNTPKMAQALAPGYTEEYKNSFAVSVDVDKKPSKKKEKSWLVLDVGDVSEHPQVTVSLDPDLPTDKGAQMQQYDLATRSGKVPTEWAAQNILEVDDLDEFMSQLKEDLLFQNDPTTKEYLLASWRKKWLEEDPERLEDFKEWAQAQLVQEEAAKAQAQQPQQGGGQQGTAPAMSPMDFFAQQGQQQGGEQPMPVGQGLPSPAMMGQPQGIPPEALGMQPPPDYLGSMGG